jgi:hypothetical protein
MATLNRKRPVAEVYGEILAKEKACSEAKMAADVPRKGDGHGKHRLRSSTWAIKDTVPDRDYESLYRPLRTKIAWQKERDGTTTVAIVFKERQTVNNMKQMFPGCQFRICKWDEYKHTFHQTPYFEGPHIIGEENNPFWRVILKRSQFLSEHPTGRVGPPSTKT